MAIRAVFWDSDNTLIDTFALHWEKHVVALAARGIALAEADRRTIFHNNGAQNWQWLVETHRLDMPQDAYLAEIDAYYAANAHRLRLRTGAWETLRFFADRGVRQAVVSNGRRQSVLTAHAALGTLPFFDFLLCKEDYEGRKPDPAPYLAGLARMADIAGVQIVAEECLAIEDDPLGAEAAKRAGMRVIYRPTAMSAPASPFADVVLGAEDDLLAAIRTFESSLRA